MDLILGIDGGGSKTAALLADLQGHVLGRGLAGSSNYQGVAIEAAAEALTQAMQGAFEDAGLAPGEPRAVCLGMAGVGRAPDRDIFGAWAAARMPHARRLVVSDAELVLAAGTPDGWGLAVIAGTGSIAWGRDRRGETGRAGGWGYLLGDEGSGYAIGLAALRAVVRAFDGRGAPTALTPAVLAHWSLGEPLALVERIYRQPLSPADIAGLAAVVDRAASEDDQVAAAILAGAGRDLAETAAAVARRLDLAGPVPCGVAGSVLVRGRSVREAFVAAAREMGLEPAPLACVEEPALGALRLARELLETG